MSSKSWKKKKKAAGKAKKSRAAKRSGSRTTAQPSAGYVSAPARRSSAPAYFNVEDLDRKLQGGTDPVTETEAPVVDAPELPHAALSTPQLLQLRIDLKGAKPPIWRRVEVRSDLTLDAVHRVIQAAFGWADAHSHRFSLDGDAALPEAQVRLDETLQETGDSLRYLYDDTDNWDHQIKVEKILDTVPAEAPEAAVTGGRRATPPENCGGLLTEAELAEVLDDPAHFDVAEANARLS